MNIVLIGNPDSFVIPKYIDEVLLYLNKDINISIVFPYPILYNRYKDYYNDKKITIIDTHTNNRILSYFSKVKIIHVLVKWLILYHRTRSLKKIDLICVHSVGFISVVFACLIKRSSSLFFVYWGSDLFRASKQTLLLIKPFLNFTDCLIFLTDSLFKKYSLEYGVPRGKYDIIDFGISALSSIKNIKLSNGYKSNVKSFFGFPLNKLCVAIGYNGIPQQQHDSVVSVLMSLPDDIKKKLHLVFHFFNSQYETDYANSLITLLKKSKISYSFLTDFFDIETTAKLRLAADIFINSQTTDALSASLVEYLYAEAIVLSPVWLDYPELKKRNIFYITYDKFEDIYNIFFSILADYSLYSKHAKNNADLLYSMYSWESLRKRWFGILNGVTDD